MLDGSSLQHMRVPVYVVAHDELHALQPLQVDRPYIVWLRMVYECEHWYSHASRTSFDAALCAVPAAARHERPCKITPLAQAVTDVGLGLAGAEPPAGEGDEGGGFFDPWTVGVLAAIAGALGFSCYASHRRDRHYRRVWPGSSVSTHRRHGARQLESLGRQAVASLCHFRPGKSACTSAVAAGRGIERLFAGGPARISHMLCACPARRLDKNPTPCWILKPTALSRRRCQTLLEKLKREQEAARAGRQFMASSCPICLEDFSPDSAPAPAPRSAAAAAKPGKSSSAEASGASPSGSNSKGGPPWLHAFPAVSCVQPL